MKKSLAGILFRITASAIILGGVAVVTAVQRSKKNKSPELAPQRTQLNPDELKKIYHALAHKYHPDQAQSPETQEFMGEIMKKVNKAYQEKDIEKLRAFL